MERESWGGNERERETGVEREGAERGKGGLLVQLLLFVYTVVFIAQSVSRTYAASCDFSPFFFRRIRCSTAAGVRSRLNNDSLFFFHRKPKPKCFLTSLSEEKSTRNLWYNISSDRKIYAFTINMLFARN